MTDRPDLLRPREPAQSLAQADRETLDALVAAVGECKSLIAGQNEAMERRLEALRPSLDAIPGFAVRLDAAEKDGAARHAKLANAVREMSAAEQTAGQHLEALRPSLDAIPDLAARIEAAREEETTRHENLTAAVQEMSKAVAGLGKRLDKAGSAHFADLRADLDTLRGTVEQNGQILKAHERQLLATVEGLKRLTELLETLATAAVETRKLQEAHAGQTKALDGLARGTSSLGGRFRRVEQALSRHGRDVRLLAISIALLVGGAIAALVIAGIESGWFADPAGASLPWLEGLAAPE
ncbi:MAG: hypothetical protein OXD40_00085 [bacterium]|nr:hypothetical protein [bacterium]